MGSSAFAVRPFSLPLGENSVSAVLRLDRSNGRWDVTVVITRAPDQVPIQGYEVDAQLIDDQGTALEVAERPSGPLVEAGGSLGTSANVLFRFQDRNVTLAQLLVTYRNQTLRFQVSAGAE